MRIGYEISIRGVDNGWVLTKSKLGMHEEYVYKHGEWAKLVERAAMLMRARDVRGATAPTEDGEL